MQRLMMGKGARRKIQAVEKVDDVKDDDEEDEDEIDARKGKRRSRVRSMNEEIYRPRVYKWRLERKK
jgi:U3 small nucleolar RNA-associated protein 11